MLSPASVDSKSEHRSETPRNPAAGTITAVATHSKGITMTSTALLGGTFAMADGLNVTRMGYGAMQLAGPGVFGPPKDRDEAIAVLREVVALGITHIDTSDFYGPYVTNELIKEALYPYPDDLVIVTKVGARRDETGNWIHARTPDEIRSAVHDNLDHLGLEALDVVNLRFGGFAAAEPESLEAQFAALAELQQQGLIRHLGVSTVSAEQIAEAQSIAPVVCVQNFYNVAHRVDDALIVSLNAQGIGYVPYFPLGGFTPLQSDGLSAVAQRLDAAPMTVALAWLLQRSPNILLIPGTSSRAHLRENVAGASLTLSDDDVAQLDAIGAPAL
jgi:pyridoxine 4-dehydrogenase